MNHTINTLKSRQSESESVSLEEELRGIAEKNSAMTRWVLPILLLKILYVLASMLKIYIYWHNAHVTPVHGHTDGHVRVEQYSAEAESAKLQSRTQL